MAAIHPASHPIPSNPLPPFSVSEPFDLPISSDFDSPSSPSSSSSSPSLFGGRLLSSMWASCLRGDASRREFGLLVQTMINHTALRRLCWAEVGYQTLILGLAVYCLAVYRDIGILPVPLTLVYLSFLVVRAVTVSLCHLHVPKLLAYYQSHRRVRLSLRLLSNALVVACLGSTQFGSMVDALGDFVHQSGSVVLTGILMVEMTVALSQLMCFTLLATCVAWRSMSLLAPFVSVQAGQEGGEEDAAKKAEARGWAEVLKSIAPLKYHRRMLCDSSCIICMSDMEEGAPMRLFTCGHGYHADCVDQWLMKRRVCPLCVSVVTLPQRRLASTIELTVRCA